MKPIISLFLFGLVVINTSNAQKLNSSDVEPQSLELVMASMNVKPIKNIKFEPYFVGDMDVQGVVPIKLAVISNDELSAKFMHRYKDKLTGFKIALLTPSDESKEQLLKAFQNKFPDLSFVAYELDESFHLMAHSLGIKAYPALYDNGHVSQ